MSPESASFWSAASAESMAVWASAALVAVGIAVPSEVKISLKPVKISPRPSKFWSELLPVNGIFMP